MDVLTEEQYRVGSGLKKRWPASRLALSAGASFYAVLVGAAVAHHEPWADEAQSWLLARDASLMELWTHLLHYEGTTGLWQTLLHGLIAVGLPYGGMNVFSGLLGLAAACVLLWRSPFPLSIRVALPFTFFLCYQYSVIARSYALLPLLLFCAAAIYTKAAERPALFTALLCLMAAVSVHGMVLAAAIGVSALVRQSGESHGGLKRFAPYAAGFAAVAVLSAVSASPAADGTFVAGWNFSFQHFIEVSGKAFATAFTGEWISSLAVVALSIPLLWRGGGWLFFVLWALCCAASLQPFIPRSGIMGFCCWHGCSPFGFLSMLVAPNGNGARRQHQLAAVSLVIVIGVQCYWSVCSMAYDWQYPYSGSQAAAQGILQSNLQKKKLYAIGFASTAIQPYFEHNIFANVNDGRPEGYWDWSRRNHVNRDSEHLAELQPDYVIVGYKNESERGVWADLVGKGGYRVIRHFEGNTYWQSRVLEPESYDLYQRNDAP